MTTYFSPNMGGYFYSYVMDHYSPYANSNLEVIPAAPWHNGYPQHEHDIPEHSGDLRVVGGPMVRVQTTSPHPSEMDPQQNLETDSGTGTGTIIGNGYDYESGQASVRSDTLIGPGYFSNPISVAGDRFQYEQPFTEAQRTQWYPEAQRIQWYPEAQRAQWYPEVDTIRKYHDLCSLVRQILPERLHNSLYGPTINIVEEDTLNVLAYRVPKKMLILMCGRATISKYLRTLEREEQDHERSQDDYGAPLQQELRIPRNSSSHVGFKILITWMRRACHWESIGAMQPIRVPKNLFAAISLARTLDFLGLHRDACRVDNIIASIHFKRPIYPDELRSIWKCLPKDNKYLYGVINVIRNRLQLFEQGAGKPLPEGVLEFMEENPLLNDRVRNSEINDEYKPHFGREWCRYLGPNKHAPRTTSPTPSTMSSPAKSTRTTFTAKRNMDIEKTRSLQETLVTEKKKFGTLTILPPKLRERIAPEVADKEAVALTDSNQAGDEKKE